MNKPGLKVDLVKSLKSFDNIHSGVSYTSKMESASSFANTREKKGAKPSMKELNNYPMDQDMAKKLDNGADQDASQFSKCHTCSRQGCNIKSRFDSVFCSDSCGVSTMETDLLKTLQYADKLHPSLLRS